MTMNNGVAYFGCTSFLYFVHILCVLEVVFMDRLSPLTKVTVTEGASH